jgi:hypothetical protein
MMMMRMLMRMKMMKRRRKMLITMKRHFALISCCLHTPQPLPLS